MEPEHVRVQRLVQEQLQVQRLELAQVQAPVRARWRRHNRGLRWLASSWHHASKVRWCRFSKRVHRCRCASCRWFAHPLRL